MLIRSKVFIGVCVVITAAAALSGIIVIRSPQLQFIEKWDSYQPSEKKVILGDCKQSGFLSTEWLAQQKASIQNLGRGKYVLITDNPLHITNQDFRDLGSVDCASRAHIPVRAYRDKLLWKNKCSGLGRMLGCGAVEKSLARWEQEYAQSSGLEFNEAGIHFTIPPHIYHYQQEYPSSGFWDFNFYTEGPTVIDNSSIYLTIPLENDVQPNFKPLGDMPKGTIRKMVNWGILQGDKYEYDYTYENEYSHSEGVKTVEIFPVSYSNYPIILTYRHTPSDDTLEVLWDNIHSEALIDLPNNLGSYQSYRIKTFGSLIND